MPDERSYGLAGLPWPVRYLADKYELSPNQAKELVERCGKDSDKLDAEARKLAS